jgi:acyl-CoA thioesterase-1
MIGRRLLALLLLCTSALFATLPARGNAACLLVLGDSISTGFGLPAGAGWVDLLRTELDDCEVVNASISGETTEGGKTRLPALLEQHQPRLVVLELGGNDGLRGFPLAVTRANLESMIAAARRAGAGVLLLGMRIPPNYGPRYAEGFHALFGELAAATGAALVPFLLEGIATDAALMQTDGVHPTADAQPLILANVLPVLLPLIRE